MGTQWSGAEPTVGAGAPYSQQMPPGNWSSQGVGVPPGGQRRQASALAVVSMAAGLFSFCLPVVGGLIAIGLGVAGIVVVRRSPQTRKGTAFAVIGIVLGLLSIVAWASLLANEDFWAGVREGFTDAQLASELTPGDCLEFPTVDTDRFEATIDDVVACSVPHAAEYIGSAKLDHPNDAPYPGDDQVHLEASMLCEEVFVAHVGRELFDTDLDLFTVFPGSIAWRVFDDRSVDCFAVTLDGSPLSGPIGSP